MIAATERYSRQLESLMEALVGLCLLLVVNITWFPDDPGYLQVSPHPFLFLTILIASRYGTFDGFVTGLLCAAVYIMYLFAGKDFEHLVRTLEWHTLIPAYLFIIMGLLLGEIRDMASREVARIRINLREMKERVETLQKDNELLRRVKEELQSRILAADDPLSRFYESANRLSMRRPEEAYPAIMDLFARFTLAEKFSLYMAEKQESGMPGEGHGLVFRLREARGWSSPDEFDTVLSADHPVVSKAIQSHEVVTVRDVDAPLGDIIACAAMFDPDTKAAIGLLVIHRIAFTRLTHLTLSHLQTIAGWTGRMLADAQRFEKAMAARVDDDVTGTYNYRYIAKRLAEEAARVKRYGGTCSFMLVRVLEIDTLSEEDKHYVMSRVGSMLKKMLRNVDTVGLYRIPGVFGIILPETSVTQSVVVSARINEAFRREFGGYGSRFAHLRLRMGVSGTSATDPVSEAKMMEEAERFELRQGTT